jgi:hypothetical protein
MAKGLTLCGLKKKADGSALRQDLYLLVAEFASSTVIPPFHHHQPSA